MIIEISNLTKSDCDESRLESVASFAMESLGIHRDSELSISLVDEDEMSALMVGDIVLCPEFAVKQAQDAGHSLQEELELLTVHGVLHLLGYDHRESDEKAIMFGLQEEFLRKWRSKV